MFKNSKFNPFGNSNNDENIFGVKSNGVKKTNSKSIGRLVLQKEILKNQTKKALKKLINPINADLIKNYIPKKNEFTFFLMNGNCQFSDYIFSLQKSIPKICEAIFTTLSLNEKTFDVLDLIHGEKHILVSSYFLATDKNEIIPKLLNRGRLDDYNIGFFRNHTKLCLLSTGSDFYVLSGSANLRSSGTIEQFTIFNDEELYSFNKSWILEIINNNNLKNGYNKKLNTGPANFDNLFNDLENE